MQTPALVRFIAIGILCVAACHGQTIASVLNAASYSSNIAPGTWVAIFGTQLAPGAASATSVPYPASLNGVSVTFKGTAAPLAYVSPTQINAFYPFEARASGVTVTTPSGVATASFGNNLLDSHSLRA